jgi:hypothetical protein
VRVRIGQHTGVQEDAAHQTIERIVGALKVEVWIRLVSEPRVVGRGGPTKIAPLPVCASEHSVRLDERVCNRSIGAAFNGAPEAVNRLFELCDRVFMRARLTKRLGVGPQLSDLVGGVHLVALHSRNRSTTRSSSASS